jgi:alginate O-acetyltransferase complex protein AlgI
MLFTDPLFLFFFLPVFLGAFSALARLAGGRFRVPLKLCILVATLVFYGWRHKPAWWLPFCAAVAFDFLWSRLLARSHSPRARRLILALSIVQNLSLLFIYKYWSWLGGPRLEMPAGISFYLFESMSYVIDVYRGDIEPHPSYSEYLAFVAFFPHLVAGPIVRPRDLLPQLAGAARFDPRASSEALFLIGVGLLKKVAIGDYLALNLIDRTFDGPLGYSALECYVAAVGYSVQIYCDFSGYTDIAIGSALLLGVRFPKNFDAPYKAHHLVDFWRRWHISLSTWLRDYLYIPLGGSRRGPARTYLNLIVTMLLGGLWHGANWTFVAWGGLHGLGLAVTRLVRGDRNPSEARSHLSRVLGVVLTFHFVTATWILFRADSFGAAWAFFGRLTTLTTYHPNLDPRALAVLAVGLLSHFWPERWFSDARTFFATLPAPAQGAARARLALKGTAERERRAVKQIARARVDGRRVVVRAEPRSDHQRLVRRVEVRAQARLGADQAPAHTDERAAVEAVGEALRLVAIGVLVRQRLVAQEVVRDGPAPDREPGSEHTEQMPDQRPLRVCRDAEHAEPAAHGLGRTFTQVDVIGGVRARRRVLEFVEHAGQRVVEVAERERQAAQRRVDAGREVVPEIDLLQLEGEGEGRDRGAVRHLHEIHGAARELSQANAGLHAGHEQRRIERIAPGARDAELSGERALLDVTAALVDAVGCVAEL